VPLGRRLLALGVESIEVDHSRRLALPTGSSGWVASVVMNVSVPALVASNSSNMTSAELAQSAAIAAIRAGFQDSAKYNASLGAAASTAGTAYGSVPARGVFTLQRVTVGGQGTSAAPPAASRPADGLSAGAIGGAVVGALFGFLLLLCLLLLLLLLLLRRRDDKKREKVPPRGNRRRSSVLAVPPGVPAVTAAEDDEDFAEFGVEIAGTAGGARRPRRNSARSHFSFGTEVTDHHRYGDDFVHSPYESSSVAAPPSLPPAEPEGTLQVNYGDEFVHSPYEPPDAAASAASDAVPAVEPAGSSSSSSSAAVAGAASSSSSGGWLTGWRKDTSGASRSGRAARRPPPRQLRPLEL
jgi:hypothetical protein